MRCQKNICYLLVFLGQDRAGGIDQRAAGSYIAGAVRENRRLNFGQTGKLGGILVAHVGLFANDAQTGAGHVAEYDVKRLVPLPAKHTPVRCSCFNAGDTEPLRAFPYPLQLIFMQVAREDRPLVFHRKRRSERLSAGSGANVKNAVSAPAAGSADGELCRRVLYREVSPVKSGKRREIAGAGKLQTVRHPRVPPYADAGIRDLTRQRLRCGFERVDLNGHGRGLVVQTKKRLRLFRAKQVEQPLHQPRRMAVSDRKLRCGFLRQLRQIRLIL